MRKQQYQQQQYQSQYQQQRLINNLSQYIKCMHNQQHSQFSQQLPSLLNLSPLHSLTLSILTHQLNLSLNNLPQNIPNTPQYYQSQQYIIPPVIRKIGQISRQLTILLQFNSQQEQYIAEFQTLKFMQLFPTQNNKQKYAQNQTHQLLLIDFIKPIYPRVNTHKHNLPLYIPFYHSYQSYYTKTPIGNPNWELARKTLHQIYRNQIIGLNDYTREDNSLQQQKNKDAWFQLLMCGNNYLKRCQNKGGVDSVWAMMHFYYMQQTLKPYRNVFTGNMFNQSELLTIEVITNKLRRLISECIESDQQVKLLYSTILYKLTQDTTDLINLVQLIKFNVQNQIQRVNNNNKLNKQDAQVTFIALANTLSSQLIRNLSQSQSHKQMRDQNKLNQLKELLTITTENIHTFVTSRLPYHQFYLRIAYPSHLAEQNQRKLNQKLLYDILSKQLSKDTKQSQQIYPFPSYPYFQRQFYSDFSKIYLNKHPTQLLQIAQFLPTNIAVWRLLNSPNLDNHNQFIQIRKILLDNKQKYIQCIKQRIPEITQSTYVNFVQSWDIYHKLLEINQQNQSQSQNQYQYQTFIEKLSKSKTNINFLSGLQSPSRFRQHVYFVLDKGQNILKMLQNMISGFQSTLKEVDYKKQKQIVNQYTLFIRDKKFQTKLLSTLTEEQKDQFWKKWAVVLLADQSLVKDLVGGEEGEEIAQNQPDFIEEKEEVPVQKKNQISKKPQNEVIIMDLEDD